MTEDDLIAVQGEIDAAMGRVLWTIGQRTQAKSQPEAMREVLASVARVLDDVEVLGVVAEAAADVLLAMVPPASGERH